MGNSIRATAATGMNDKSSRSHSVFTMVMTQTKVLANTVQPLPIKLPDQTLVKGEGAPVNSKVHVLITLSFTSLECEKTTIIYHE